MAETIVDRVDHVFLCLDDVRSGFGGIAFDPVPVDEAFLSAEAVGGLEIRLRAPGD